jgi:hypothetical protein
MRLGMILMAVAAAAMAAVGSARAMRRFTLPPLGASDCRMAQVCNMFGNCRWQRVCE